jgi:hypothetical protein
MRFALGFVRITDLAGQFCLAGGGQIWLALKKPPQISENGIFPGFAAAAKLNFCSFSHGDLSL